MPSNLVLIAGRKRSGKSTLLRTLVNYHLDRHDDVRFVVWDRTVEWVPRDRVTVLPANQFTGEQAARYALDNAPCTLVVDEIDLIAPSPAGLKAGSALHAIVHYGRHENVALLCAARRSANVHIDIRALADTIFFFRHTEPADLDWIDRLCGQEWAENVRSIPPFQFLRLDL